MTHHTTRGEEDFCKESSWVCETLCVLQCVDTVLKCVAVCSSTLQHTSTPCRYVCETLCVAVSYSRERFYSTKIKNKGARDFFNETPKGEFFSDTPICMRDVPHRIAKYTMPWGVPQCVAVSVLQSVFCSQCLAVSVLQSVCCSQCVAVSVLQFVCCRSVC